MDKIIIDPWKIEGDVDYARVMKDFGIKKMPKLPEEFSDHVLFRRNTIFAQRDFEIILKRLKEKKPFAMMTGLMPSGNLHLGHAMLVQQMIFYQKLGAKIYLAVADLEAYNARKLSLEEQREVAIDQYLTNYVAMGLDLDQCEIYFQSERSPDAAKTHAYYALASNFSRYATFNEFKGVYGEISPGKMNASLIQAADMYHPQLPEFEGGPIPTFIPVGIDQDPHIRLARDMARKNKDHEFIPIASTYHLFLPGLLGGGKMSSSNPNSYIALTDDSKTVRKKINKYAFSGGQETVEEHKKKGGNTDVDISFQYLRIFFEPSDEKLNDIKKKYESGEMLTGELKAYLIDKINAFLEPIQKNRAQARKKVEAYLKKRK